MTGPDPLRLTEPAQKDTAEILVVDDDPATCLLLRRFMEQDGHRVRVAKNGAEALSACADSTPDLILLDYIMPDVDGVDVCAQLRLQERYATTPILMVTGMNDDGSVKSALDAGASDFITKPVIFPVLRQRVRHLLAGRRAEQFMRHLAYHDPLTGLPNRAHFHERLTRALASSDGSVQHAVMYLDLDRFKAINDACGHTAGDELLRQIVALLLGKLRQDDMLARLGGDEFGVLLNRCAAADALNVAEKLRDAVSQFKFYCEQRVFSVGVSIGIAALDGHCGPLSHVLSAADAACYMAKDAGRNRVELYLPDSEEVQRRRGDLGWVERINAALANEGFVLVGQPIVAAHAGHAQERHLEVLSRMLDVTGEQIPPGKFIPTAERYNLMPQIDRWVVAHALATLREQRAWENGLTTAWVNLSAATVGDPGFAQFVREQLQRYQVPARGLCFEITETAAIANVARAAQFISELSQHGVRFALDDFGAGLSSFGYLKHLAIDFLKIDGGFVGNILRNPVDHAIVRAINEIGHVMQICTVAEWVETPEVLAELRRLGVDFVQGFGIARPMPLAAFQPAQQHLLPA